MAPRPRRPAHVRGDGHHQAPVPRRAQHQAGQGHLGQALQQVRSHVRRAPRHAGAGRHGLGLLHRALRRGDLLRGHQRQGRLHAGAGVHGSRRLGHEHRHRSRPARRGQGPGRWGPHGDDRLPVRRH